MIVAVAVAAATAGVVAAAADVVAAAFSPRPVGSAPITCGKCLSFARFC